MLAENDHVTWHVDTGSTVRKLPGDTHCGDAIFTWSDGSRGLFALVDALGHGAVAELSARVAIATLARHAGAPLGELFVQVHAALEGKRGVVMSVVHIDVDTVTFAGVGNVELVAPADASRPPCMPGVVGSGRLYLRPARLAVMPGSRWGLVSDGIRHRELKTAWESAARLAPQAAAAAVLEAGARDDDDASVLVLDFRSEPS
jgi:hypothetical protein